MLCSLGVHFRDGPLHFAVRLINGWVMLGFFVFLFQVNLTH